MDSVISNPKPEKGRLITILNTRLQIENVKFNGIQKINHGNFGIQMTDSELIMARCHFEGEQSNL